MSDKLRAAAQAVLAAWDNDEGMPDFPAAIEQLRAALTEYDSDWSLLAETQASLFEHMAEIHRLRAALAGQDAEPVAWKCAECGGFQELCPHGNRDIPVYSHPTRREWQGLTDEEILAAYESSPARWDRHLTGLRAIEAALKGKNA